LSRKSVKEQKVPRVLAAHRELSEAQSARKSGNPKRAITLYKRLLAKYPDYVGALHELGIAQMAVRDYRGALDSFIRATMLHPDDWTTLASLAQCYVQLNALEMAARTLEQARAINNNDAEIHFTLGAIYERQREYEAAETALRQALAKNPDHAMAANLRGTCLVHLGELEEAAKAFHQSHASDPARIGPIAASAQLPSGISLIDVDAAMPGVTPDQRLKANEHQATAAFAAASLFHKQAKHKEAWGQLMRANRLVRKQLDGKVQRRKIFRKQISALRDKTTAAIDSDMVNPDLPDSLFILGVSRSGKTTLERAVGGMPGVKRGYENPIVELAVNRTSQKAGLLTIGSLLELPVELGKHFTSEYVKEIKRRAGNVRVFTNTHPGRIADAGLLAQRVPNAKFVFVVRNREDTALRILMKQYQDGTNAYAYDVKEVFDEIDWYHQMISDWHERLPEISAIIEYDKFAGDPSTISQAVEKLCKLEPTTESAISIPDDRGCAQPYHGFFDV